MRVIAGEYRHRLLEEVPGTTTRPTTDKNREMLFNILGQFFEGGVCLDLFAGSGAIGIESISRGFSKAVFVDQANSAIQTIQKNLAKLNIPATSFQVIRDEALHAISRFAKGQFAFIYLDPPYAAGLIPVCLDQIEMSAILAETGIVCAETDKATILPDTIGKFAKTDQRLTGNTQFTFYEWRKQS